MSFFGKNIRKIRTIKKLSQTDFGARFDITRATIGAYEEHRAEPKISTAIAIANYFNISLDALLKKDITINELTHFDSLNRSGGKNELRNAGELSEIPFVSAADYREYPVKRTSNDYVRSLTRLSIPPFSQAKLRAFEVVGSQMENGNGGIRNGDVVIGHAVNHASNSLEIDQIYIVVSETSITLCRLLSIGRELTFQYDNRSYPNSSIKKDDIKEVWKIYRWITSDLPDKLSINERVKALEEILAKQDRIS